MSNYDIFCRELIKAGFSNYIKYANKNKINSLNKLQNHGDISRILCSAPYFPWRGDNYDISVEMSILTNYYEDTYDMLLETKQIVKY